MYQRASSEKSSRGRPDLAGSLTEPPLILRASAILRMPGGQSITASTASTAPTTADARPTGTGRDRLSARRGGRLG